MLSETCLFVFRRDDDSRFVFVCFTMTTCRHVGWFLLFLFLDFSPVDFVLCLPCVDPKKIILLFVMRVVLLVVIEFKLHSVRFCTVFVSVSMG